MPSRFRLAVFSTCTALFCLALSGRSARAGIVNVQSVLATEANEGLSGNLSGSLDWRTGNIDYLFVSASPVARVRMGDHLLIGIVRLERKSSQGTTLVSRTFEHLRYRYTINDWLLGEVFAQHEYDAIRRLQLRSLVGAGPKIDLFEGKGYGLAFGVAYMLEYERLRDDMEIDAGARDFQHRISSYLVGHYEIDDRLQVVGTTYAQPEITEPSDVRFLLESSLVVSLTKQLSLSNTFNVSYDSRPPATIEKVDTALITSVAYEFD